MNVKALTEAAQIAAGLAKNPAAPITPSEAPALAKELMPYVEHLTNTEEWFRSRVTLGSLASIVGGVLAIAAGIKAGSWDPELYTTGLAGVLGGSFALYGRWKARKPIGA